MSKFRDCMVERLTRAVGVTEGAEEAAACLEAEALRYVRRLSAERYHGPIMDWPDLANEWPLHAGLLCASDAAKRAILEALLRDSLPVGDLLWRWHPDVSRNEIVSALEGVRGDESAAWFAERLRAGVLLTYGVNVAFGNGDVAVSPTIFRLSPGGGAGYYCKDVYTTRLEYEAGGDGPAFVGGDPPAMPGHVFDGGQWASIYQPHHFCDAFEATGEDLEMVRAGFDFIKSGRWWHAPAVALVVAATKRVAVEVDPVAQARFGFDLVAEMARGDEAAAAKRLLVVDDLLSELAPDHASARRPEAAEALERALRLAAEKMRPRCRFDVEPPSTEAGATAMRDGRLVYDVDFACFLESFGAHGEIVAEKVRASAANRARAGDTAKLWRLWADQKDVAPPGCRWARLLAEVLWFDRVSREVEERLRKLPALVQPVHRAAVDFHSRGRRFDETSSQLSFEGREIAALAAASGASFDLELLKHGLGLLGSVASHDVFCWEVLEAYDRHVRGVPYPNVLEIVGGWSALARRLGYDPDKHARDVRGIVHAQAHFAFTFPDGSRGNMLSYTETPARGHGRAVVTITIGSPLLPGYAEEIEEKRGRRAIDSRRARKLVPLLERRPRLYGRKNEHGQQISLAMAVVAEMREQAPELVRSGGALIEGDRFTQLADRAALPRRLLRPVLDCWTSDGKDGEDGFLHRVDADRYTLGKPYEAERRFLEDAGRREIDGKKRGKAGAAKRSTGPTRRLAPRTK